MFTQQAVGLRARFNFVFGAAKRQGKSLTSRFFQLGRDANRLENRFGSTLPLPFPLLVLNLKTGLGRKLSAYIVQSVLVCLVALSFTNCSPKATGSETVTGQTSQALSTTDSIIVEKAFHFFIPLTYHGQISRAVQNNPALQNIQQQYYNRVSQALRQCVSAPCAAQALQWTDAELQTIGNALVQLYQTNNDFRQVVPQLKKSKRFIILHDEVDTTFLRKAWELSAKGLNRVQSVYVMGTKPHYASIDSISFSLDDPAFHQQVLGSFTTLAERHKPSSSAFFQLPLQASLQALRINGRDEAARYEPLTGGSNANAYEKAKTVNWDQYKYSVILVPGSGPDNPIDRISPKGKSRCEQGVKRYKAGLAPFIAISGGHVYPFKTPYAEAVEMKRYMVEELGIPDSDVIIEPHARHTTTNLRNLNRIIFRFNMPTDKPVLVVTDQSQTNHIAKMAARCERELGYVPYRELKKLNNEETSYLPHISAFQGDPNDPLDP